MTIVKVTPQFLMSL